MDQPPAMALRGAVLYATSTTFRTGLLLSSMPVISSTFPALPPQPSWRMRLMISRSGMSRRAALAWVSEITRSLPHRSQVIRRNYHGKALNGSPIASLPVGSGSVP
jgi:hypothetical protein